MIDASIVVIDELSTCTCSAYRYILVRAQITLANCKMFVFLVFDHLIKNKKTNIVRTSP